MAFGQTADQRIKAQTKFPPEFDQPVDSNKVQMDVMKPWIVKEMIAALGDEDEIVIDFCHNWISSTQFPDIKDLHIFLQPFLHGKTAKFTKELWNLLLSAQSTVNGVPPELVAAKKAEMQQQVS
ncbi:PWI domain-containing protein [Amniculicola lignicola CBS 123094]|uniref:PWI domain-containing protein n=1 Tax=Amniculicola lignicola CBS 123094 TaxID=1392246 RepID=A0A6A5WJJ4_9PLEO|nr:PWI domain-containing protein [Amniculicola lignicola CBS 123094]